MLLQRHLGEASDSEGCVGGGQEMGSLSMGGLSDDWGREWRDTSGIRHQSM